MIYIHFKYKNVVKTSIDITPHEYPSADGMYFVYSLLARKQIKERVYNGVKTTCPIQNGPVLKNKYIYFSYFRANTVYKVQIVG